jgi:hypothetical protein
MGAMRRLLAVTVLVAPGVLLMRRQITFERRVVAELHDVLDRQHRQRGTMTRCPSRPYRPPFSSRFHFASRSSVGSRTSFPSGSALFALLDLFSFASLRPRRASFQRRAAIFA